MEEAINFGPRTKMINSKHLKTVLTLRGDRYEACLCTDPDCPRFAADGSMHTVDNVPENMWKYPPLTVEDLVKARLTKIPPATERHLKELQFFQETTKNPRSREEEAEVAKINVSDYGYVADNTMINIDYNLTEYQQSCLRLRNIAMVSCFVVLISGGLGFIIWLFSLFSSPRYGHD